MERKPIGSDSEPKKKKQATEETPKPAKKKPQPEKEENIYSSLAMDDAYDEGDDDDDEVDLDGDDDENYSDPSWFQKNKPLVIIGGVALVIIGLVLYFVFKPDPPPPVVEEPPPVVEEDPYLKLREELYQKGIGKESLNGAKIYEQGNLTSEDFRKDFLNTSASETYVEPVKIATVNDSVSYTKYRTQTDDGMDTYWVDAVYKEKKTAFTVPYYIWRTLTQQGVMDVVVEVITDDNENVFIGSITAKPPANGGN